MRQLTDQQLDDAISALLVLVDIAERVRGKYPRTAEIRKWYKSQTLIPTEASNETLTIPLRET